MTNAQYDKLIQKLNQLGNTLVDLGIWLGAILGLQLLMAVLALLG